MRPRWNEAASKVFADRGNWLKPYQRIAILQKLAGLMENRREHLGRQVTQEGRKPLTDALVETDRAIDGVRNAAEVQAGSTMPPARTPRARAA